MTSSSSVHNDNEIYVDDSPKDVRYEGQVFFDSTSVIDNEKRRHHPNGKGQLKSSFSIRNRTNGRINGYKSTFSFKDFWSRYYVLSDFEHIESKSKCDSNTNDDNVTDEKLMFHLKRLITKISMQLWYMDQEEIVEDEPNDIDNNNDQPFDIPTEHKNNKKTGMPSTLFTIEGLTMDPKRTVVAKLPRLNTSKAVSAPSNTDDDDEEEDFDSLNFSSRCALVGLQLGKSKVFVRRETYDRMEWLRYSKIVRSAILIQDVLYFNAHKRYPARLKYATQKIQKWIRMKRSSFVVCTPGEKSKIILACSVIKIQRAWKKYTTMKLTQRVNAERYHAAVTIQKTYRRYYLAARRRRRNNVFRESSETIKAKGSVQRSNISDSSIGSEPVEQLIERQFSNVTSAQSSSVTSNHIVDNETLLTELFKEIEHDNWGMVTAIIGKYPGLVQSNDIKNGENLLHKIARKGNVWPELMKLIITIDPSGLSQPDNMGALPAHHAAAFDNVNELSLLCELFHDGIFIFDKMGRLPIHVAAMYDAVDAVKFLLLQSSDLALAKIIKPPPKAGGGLPIHVACTNNASLDVISALIAADVSTIKLPDENGDLPVHLLLRCGEVADETVVKALITCFPGVLSRTDSYGNLPLAIAIKCQCTYPVIKCILNLNNEAARILNGLHQSPLVLALVNRADDRTILALLNEAPELATAVDIRTGLLPIQIATEYEHSQYIVHNLLMRDLPIDINEKVRARLIPHHYSWNHIVSNTDDLYHQVVAQLLKTCTQPQVLALAHIEGPDGKSALFAATTVSKHEIRVMLRLFGTLEVLNERAAYANVENGTQIFYALRYDPSSQQNVNIAATFSIVHESTYKKGSGAADDYLEDFDDNSIMSTASRNSIRSTLTARSYLTIEDRMRHIKNEKGQHVIAKLTPRSDLVERELKVRKEYHLSRHYIPAILSVHHTVQHAAYYEAMAESGYCITMEGADATCENQLSMLRKSDRRTMAKTLKRIGVSLLHMHEHGLVHSDFGAHNVGKFGSRWKLLSVGGSVPIGSSTDPNRGMFHPPESVHIEAKRIPLKKHGKASIISIKAHPTYDIWSFGALVYCIVACMPLGPYVGRDKVALPQKALHKIGSWDENSIKKELCDISEDDVAHDLIKRMLHPDPKMRIKSMRKVLEHAFFTGSKSSKHLANGLHESSIEGSARNGVSIGQTTSEKNSASSHKRSIPSTKTTKELEPTAAHFAENRDVSSSEDSDSGMPETKKSGFSGIRKWKNGLRRTSDVEGRILI